MSDREAFWNAICVEPDDDAPRLVFADWLDEQGDHAHAEFIRVQCARASLSQADADFWTLGDHERSPGCFPDHSWREVFPEPLREVGFERGFPAVGGEIHSRCLLANGSQFMQLGPVGRLRLWVNSTDSAALVTCRALGRVGRLHLNVEGMRLDELFGILASPHLTQLVGLGIQSDRLGQFGLEQLANWPGLDRLRDLTLVCRNATWADLQPLLHSPHVSQLRQFHGREFRSEADGASVLFTSPTLRSLETLWLGEVFDEAAVIRMADTLTLSSLRSLTIRVRDLGVPGVTALARCAPLASLRGLALNAGQLGPTAAGVLAASPYLRELAIVALDQVGLDNRGLEVLASGFFSANLRFLSLAHTQVDDTGLEALTRANLTGLRCLDLTSCNVRGQSFASLTRTLWAPALQMLNLCGCPLDDEAIERLAFSADDPHRDELERRFGLFPDDYPFRKHRLK